MPTAANSEDPAGHGRREFLRAATALTGLAMLPATVQPAAASAASAGPADAPPVIYQSLGPNEAAFVEHLVEVMCPADEFTPGGVACGLAVYIDRQLAGSFGRGERLYLRGPWRPGAPADGYQLPLTPERFFKLGLAAVDELCLQQHGRAFAALSSPEADALLQAVASDRAAHPEVALHTWFNELVYPLFEQACFADPFHGGNRDKVFWKMIGYPGLPAVNGLNIVRYRGKPFPGARAPQSMEDFG